MELAPKHYLLIYALIVTPIAISFFFLRRGRTPTKLNLTPTPSSPSTTSTTSKGKAQEHGAWKPSPRTPHGSSQRAATATDAGAGRGGERALNVFFQWNGHTWDAYEVLGIPAGSSLDAVQASYQRAVAQGDSESLLFFKAALEAIMRSRN